MIFRFKQFEVKHSESLLKVNTDAVLLGALVQSNIAPEKILDIGTGSGIIALMLAQRFLEAEIHAIEIDPQSCEEANYNFENSTFRQRLRAYQGSLQQMEPKVLYNLICSNPPYFETPDFAKGKNKQSISETRKKYATHFSLNFEDLLFHVVRLLQTSGKFWVIIPENAREAFVVHALKHHLYLEEQISIRSKPNAAFIRCVLCFGKQETTSVTKKELTIYNQDGSRHPEYEIITSAYYL